MFKYLRTVNNDSHPTEISLIHAPVRDNIGGSVRAGTIISADNGRMTDMYNSQFPKYLALTSKTYQEDDYVKCIRITKGMVLEADLDPNTVLSEVQLNSLCDITLDDYDKGAYLQVNLGPIFEIIDDSNKKNGKITVVVI